MKIELFIKLINYFSNFLNENINFILPLFTSKCLLLFSVLFLFNSNI